MLVGAHCPVSGGYASAMDYLDDIGGNTLQIFYGNPRGWRKKPVDPVKAEEFKRLRAERNTGPLLIHSPYLINIATRGKVYEKSVKALEEQVTGSEVLGAEYFILHPGSSAGGDLKAGIERVTLTLNRLLDSMNPSVKILLENTAGGKSSVGRDLDTLLLIRENTGKRVGLCLDTSHAFQSGLDPDSFLSHEFTRYADVVHANDSKTPLGSGLDRHTHIGEGHIGVEGFRKTVNHSRLLERPFIIETPGGSAKDRENISLLKSLRAQ